jgi:hypothetical protein
MLNKIISDFPRLIDGKKHEFDAANMGTASRAVWSRFDTFLTSAHEDEDCLIGVTLKRSSKQNS